MGRRNKLEKFETILEYSNVIEHIDVHSQLLQWDAEQELDMKGQWKSLFFKNDNPIVLELACGRGEYALQLGRKFSNKNFLGVDIKGARIWKGATKALEEGLDNVGFLRTRIEQIDRFFNKGEVDEIWITFPDPFHNKANRRLTSSYFIDRYKKILKPNGIIHLKTDDDVLYESTCEVYSQREDITIIYQSDHIYNDELAYEELAFKTYYEGMHLGQGKTIKYIRVKLA